MSLGPAFDVTDMTLAEWLYINCRNGDVLQVEIITGDHSVRLVNLERRIAITSHSLSQRDEDRAREPTSTPRTMPPTSRPG